ncbi:muscleblind-like protein 2 isoform X2 [Oppia nitens]|uniref:muscleblind-like protein 2 isoform X2 n=1 Tax=Oppia nitens TaxID=1686743 RepID=UPI0023DC8B26|nr:muscleblind-like protein 2 isoform X2 [Oppia nitens]
MAMVNTLANVKDSRWLQLEVCREYQRNKCSRADSECKFAHPNNNVEVQNGRVIACYDSIKGRCNREKPPCKYFHPPQHLKDQLLINGRNHLALKNALLQQMPLQTVLTGQLPMVGPTASLLTAYSRPLAHQIAGQQRAAAAVAATASLLNGAVGHLSNNTTNCKGTGAYMANMPALASASAYGAYPTAAVLPGLMSAADHLTTNYGVVPSPTLIASSHKTTRTDRLEVCREFQRGNCKRSESECRFAHPPDYLQVDANDGVVTVCMDFVKGRCSREQCRYLHPPPHLLAQLKAAQNRPNSAALTFPGVVPLSKRPALEKSGLPVYQPTAAYQQALAMHQSFVPFSFYYPVAGHPNSIQRF